MIQPEPVQAVISDLLGVLTSSVQGSFAFVQESAGIPLDALGRAMRTVTDADGVNPLHELECGRVSEAAFMARLGEVIAADIGHPVAMDAFSEHYFRHLHTNHEMLELIGSVRARGLRTALLTNNVREWEPRWKAMLPVEDLFELVVDSAFVGMRKPDPEIFLLTCRRLDLPPSACLFIDDFPHNCDAARELGIRSVCFVDTAQTIADVERELAA